MTRRYHRIRIEWSTGDAEHQARQIEAGELSDDQLAERMIEDISKVVRKKQHQTIRPIVRRFVSP